MTAVFAKAPDDAMQIGMKVGAAWLLIALLSACSTASGPVRPEPVGPASDGPDPVLRALGKIGIDVLFGNIGQDFVANFESFTLDFVNMTFSLGFPLPAHS